MRSTLKLAPSELPDSDIEARAPSAAAITLHCVTLHYTTRTTSRHARAPAAAAIALLCITLHVITLHDSDIEARAYVRRRGVCLCSFSLSSIGVLYCSSVCVIRAPSTTGRPSTPRPSSSAVRAMTKTVLRRCACYRSHVRRALRRRLSGHDLRTPRLLLLLLILLLLLLPVPDPFSLIPPPPPPFCPPPCPPLPPFPAF